MLTWGAVPAALLGLIAPASAQADIFEMSAEIRELRQQVVAASNNGQLDFVIIDKVNARVHVFGAKGDIRGSSPVLLGLAKGDDSVAGIGERPMSKILPGERTTPAGRFVGEPGRNTQGEDIIWIDYDAAVSMHRVRSANKADRRMARLATPTAKDNRISYGCVNVPAAFYDALIKPLFATRPALVYILPETRSIKAQFGAMTGQAR